MIRNKRMLLVLLSVLLVMMINPANGQFGKNKVQYRTFEWKYIESKHFDIYYDAGSKYLAKFTAIAAEKALSSIQSTLNFKINKRITYVVYDSHNEFQQTNVISQYMPEGVGGVTEMLKNRIVVPFQGDYGLFDHVIHHELVHAVINDMFYGGTIQSSISVNAFQIPDWLNEGLAEYESYGGMDANTDMFMRDIVISEFLPPLQQLGGYMAYRGGQTFYWYVANKYGKERVGDFVNRLRVMGNLNNAFQSCFHISFEDFSEQWQKDLKKMYWPDLDVYKDLNDFSTAVTNHKKENNFYNSSPAISPDGEKVAFIADKDQLFRVFVQNIDKKESRKEIVSSFRKQDFEDLNLLTPGISWSPDGKKLAISAKAGGEDAIFTVDEKTGDYDKLNIGYESISSVEWSPDGSKLAFIASRIEKSDIYIYDFKSSKAENLTNDVFDDAHPIWSPDSKRIYFISNRGSDIDLNKIPSDFPIWGYDYNTSDIYSIDIETRLIKRITDDPGNQKTSISISSDESKILYVSDKSGIGNIYELDMKTGISRPKTNSLNGITQLSLAKDGSRLLFCAQSGAGYDIFFIKYPFDVHLDTDTIPVTRLVKIADDKKFLSLRIADSTKSEEFSSFNPDSVSGYGKYSIDFSRQQLVEPNKDAAKTYSEPGKEEVTLADTAFIEHDYKIKFTPDLILGNPGVSTYWGIQGITQFLFSDMLGDHQIYAELNLYRDLINSTILVQYLYMPKIIDYSIGAFHYAGTAGLYEYDTSQYRTYFRFRNFGVNLGAFYPFNMFNRLEFGLSVMGVLKDNIDHPEQTTQSAFLVVPQLKYIYDDVLWGDFAPESGRRYFISLKGMPKVSESAVGFFTTQFDFRQYIKFWDYTGLALRGTAGGSFGPDAQKFFIGGTENWFNPCFYNGQLPFNKPEDFAFINERFIYPLRGYCVGNLTGTKYFAMNAELRFPLFRALLAGPIPILFQSVMSSLFVDVAGAWDDDFVSARPDANGYLQPQNLLTSAGIGIRSYLLGLPVKFDVAWRDEYSGWSEPYYLVSLGFDF